MRGCLLLQYVSLLFLAAMQTKCFAVALNDLLVIKHKFVVAAVKMSPCFLYFTLIIQLQCNARMEKWDTITVVWLSSTGTADWLDCWSDVKNSTEAIKKNFDTFSDIMILTEFNIVDFSPLKLCNSLLCSSCVELNTVWLGARTKSVYPTSLVSKENDRVQHFSYIFWENVRGMLRICRGEECTFVKISRMLFNMLGWCVSWSFCRRSPELWF